MDLFIDRLEYVRDYVKDKDLHIPYTCCFTHMLRQVFTRDETGLLDDLCPFNISESRRRRQTLLQRQTSGIYRGQPGQLHQ